MWQARGSIEEAFPSANFELTDRGIISEKLPDGSFLVDSFHPEHDPVSVPIEVVRKFFLKNDSKLAIGDDICYMAKGGRNAEFTILRLARTIQGWARVTDLENGHGFLVDDSGPAPMKISFFSKSIVDDLWQFNNLQLCLRIGDQLNYAGWAQKASDCFKAETVKFPRMVNSTGHSSRPHIGLIILPNYERLDAALFCQPYGPVLLHRDDIYTDDNFQWPPRLGSRFIFKLIKNDQAKESIIWRAILAKSCQMLFKKCAVFSDEQKSLQVEDDFRRESCKSWRENDEKRDESFHRQDEKPNSASSSRQEFSSSILQHSNESSDDEHCTASSLPVDESHREAYSSPKVDQTAQTKLRGDSAENRFINTVINDQEIMTIITKRYQRQLLDLFSKDD